MGLFDRFKKNKQTKTDEPTINNMQQENNVNNVQFVPYDVQYHNNGSIQIEFYDRNSDFKTFYDTTRLIINNRLNIEGHQIYNCAVSWYGQNDCIMIDKTTGEELGRAGQYRGVLVELDLQLLLHDKNYHQMVMKGLLNKDRVEKYLNEGLKETPEIPCGKYIGGVRQTENGYKKFFDMEVGRSSHNSDLMKKRRQQNREMKETQKQNAIKEKEAQIAKLQNELKNIQMDDGR